MGRFLNFGLIFRILPYQCAHPKFDYTYLLVWSTVLPIIFSLVLVLCYWASVGFLYLTRSNNKETVRAFTVAYFYLFVLFTYLIIPSISVIVGNAFNCTDVDPDRSTDENTSFLT